MRAAVDFGAQAREGERANRERADDADFGDADRRRLGQHLGHIAHLAAERDVDALADILLVRRCAERGDVGGRHLPLTIGRSEEHTSELQSLMRISYAVFCLKKKNKNTDNTCACKETNNKIYMSD